MYVTIGKTRTTAAAAALLALGLVALLSAPPVFASGTKRPPTPTGGGSKPTDVLDGDDGEAELLPEGLKIAVEGTLVPCDDCRHRIRSSDTGREYIILENSILETMVKAAAADADQVFKVSARITAFEGENYLFVTSMEPVQ